MVRPPPPQVRQTNFFFPVFNNQHDRTTANRAGLQSDQAHTQDTALYKTIHSPYRKITRVDGGNWERDFNLAGHACQSVCFHKPKPRTSEEKDIWKPWQHTVLAAKK